MIFQFYRIPQISLNTPITTTSAQTLYEELERKYGAKYVQIEDEWKHCYNKAVWDQFANIDLTRLHPYVFPSFDCNKYAAIVYGDALAMLDTPCFGQIDVVLEDKTTRHSLNFFRDDAGIYWYFEPQNNTMYTFDSVKYQIFFVHC